MLQLVEKYENIVGIKETIDSIGHIENMITTVKSRYPDFVVFAGFDNHLFNTLTLGGDGAICASVNFAPEIAVGLYKAFREDKLETAVQFHRKIAGLPKMYSLDSPFIGVVKEAMKLRGLDISTCVLAPSRELSTEKSTIKRNFKSSRFAIKTRKHWKPIIYRYYHKGVYLNEKAN